MIGNKALQQENQLSNKESGSPTLSGSLANTGGKVNEEGSCGALTAGRSG